MEKIRSWWYKGKDYSPEIKGPELKGATENDVRGDENDNHITSVHVKREVVDPKVADYFKDFPEPYKTKAIERFSSREGLYKLDLFRDIAMRREFEAGKRGKFLEDKRNFARKIKEMEEYQVEKAMDEMREDNENREIPEWEKVIRSRIPVHKDETVGLKLFQTANFTVLGVLVLWAGVTLKRRNPKLPNWQYYTTIAGTSYVCGYCQVAAAYRLMDWGPFDRSVDNRDALTKTSEEIVQYFSSLAERLIDGKDES